MGEYTLSKKLRVDLATARAIRSQFKKHYRTLWDWLESVVRVAYWSLYLETPLGWPLKVNRKLDSFTLRNHLIQATGGDILRAACLFAQDAGLEIIASLHDSLLLEADADEIEFQAIKLAEMMGKGAEGVIGIPVPAEIEFIGQRYLLKGPAVGFFEDVFARVWGSKG
jgi:DNA polymerase I-like protein with 3'-5' exonuclease and polymerase domains